MPLDLSDFEPTPATHVLRVDVILEELDRDDPDSAKALREALAGDERRFPAERIAKTVREKCEMSLSGSAVRNWRIANG